VDCKDVSVAESETFTYSAWIKTNESGADRWIVSEGSTTDNDPIAGIINEDGVARVFWRNDSGGSGGNDEVIGTADINDNNWHHIVGTSDGTTLELYVDGVNDGSDTSLVGGTATLNTCGIGVLIRASKSSFFNGTIDEVMIFNTSLTRDQVLGLYENSSARFRDRGIQTLKFQEITPGEDETKLTASYQSNMGSNLSARVGYWDVLLGYNETASATDGDLNYGLIGYWHFDEANLTNGTVLQDFSGQGNNGTVYANTTGGAVGDISNASGAFSRKGVFDGDGDWVQRLTEMVTDYPFTQTAWFKTDMAGTGAITSSQLSTATNRFQTILIVSGNIRGRCTEGATTEDAIAPDSSNDNNWHFVAYVGKNDTHRELWIDGLNVVNNINDCAYDGGVSHDIFTIGMFRDSTPGSPFDGFIDEVMFFNRTLSEDEIRQLYTKGRALWEYSEYSLFDGTGSDAVNLSISDNSTHILPEFLFEARSYSFYSPILEATSQRPIFLNVSEVTSPNVTINLPSNNSKLNSVVKINASATDDNNVSIFIDYGLVSWWRMDDTNGTANSITDYLGLNNGTVVGDAVQNDSGYFGKAVEFDGDGDYVDVVDDASLDPGTKDWSGGAWIETNTAARGVIIGKRTGGAPGYSFDILNTGYLRFYADVSGSSAYTDSNTTVDDNQWHHVAFTYDRSSDSISLYLDGFDDTGTKTGGLTSSDDITSTQNTEIGSRVGGATFPFNGTIDDVMIWNRSLSGEEIKGLYANQTTNYLNSSVNLTDGVHNITYYAQDTSGNIGSGSAINILYDTTFPTLTYIDPSPRDGGAINSTSVTINVSAEDTVNNISGFIDDGSLVSWWRMDDINDTGGVIDYLGCYDDKTEILTLNADNEKEWKLFEDLGDEERVATLNNETGELEWQVPVEKQIYDNKGEMYRIVLEEEGTDGNIEESELLVSEEHRVYAGYQNNSENSDLLKTLTADCFFSSLSSDIIEAFNLSARATKSTSFRCFGIKDTALEICLEYSENGINLTTFFRFNLSSSNSLEERFDFLSISDSCLSNSVMANSGEYTLCPADNNFLINAPFQKNEYNLLVSNTSFIYNIHPPP